MSIQTKGLKIRSKLLAMVMLLILVSIGVGGIAYYGFHRSNQTLSKIQSSYIPELTRADDIAYLVAKARRYEKEFFLFSSVARNEANAKKQRGYLEELHQTYSEAATVIKSLENLESTEGTLENPDQVELETLTANLRKSYQQVQISLVPLAEKLLAGNSFLDAQKEYGVYKGDVRNLENSATALRDNVLTKIENLRAESTLFTGKLTTLIIFVALGAIVFGLIAGIFVANRITNPLNVLMHGIESVGQGDIVEIEAPSHDEFAEIARIFNETIARLKRYIQTDDQRQKTEENVINFLEVVSDASDGDLTVRAPVTEDAFGSIADAYNLMIESLADLLRETNKDAHEVGEESRKLNTIFQRIKQGAEDQLLYVTDATDAADNTADAASQISEKASQAQNATRRVDEATNLGSNQVSKNIEGMQLIRVTVQVINKKMKSLSERLLEIGTISQLISDVATRTTILAMNASIEASRAGEQGRGFMVISDEIKRLADESSEATREIGGIIKAIQTEANEVTATLEEETSTVEQQTRIAQETGVALEDIEKATQQSKQVVNDISLLSKNQHEISDRMVNAIRKMADITAQTSTLVTEASQISEGLNGVSEKLLSSLSQFVLNKEVEAAQPVQEIESLENTASLSA